MVAKAYFPAGECEAAPVLLDAIHLCPMPGDPTLANYDDMLPDFCNPLVLAMGSVAEPPINRAGGALTFPITVTEFVRGGMKESIVQYVLFLFVSLCSTFVSL